MQVWSGMQVWYAGLVCRSGMQVWYAGLVCRSGMECRSGLVCRSGMQVWCAGLVWNAGLVCRSGVQVWCAGLLSWPTSQPFAGHCPTSQHQRARVLLERFLPSEFLWSRDLTITLGSPGTWLGLSCPGASPAPDCPPQGLRHSPAHSHLNSCSLLRSRAA